jgi:ADP-dependent NAD(P)H-hydrate dehydratase
MPIQRVTELPKLPTRPADAHKGTCGRVLIVAGSRGMSGAAALAGLGALRGGAGLVFVAVPEGIAPTVASIEPSYLTIPLPDDSDGRLGISARSAIAEAAAKSDAVAIGPGCGQSEELSELIRWLYVNVEVSMVVDADGLNALSKNLETLHERIQSTEVTADRILTPHPGEFARLSPTGSLQSQADREDAATRFSRDNRVVLLLKGHRTVIADGQMLAVNETGNSGMATGGTGDVLTGLITALLGQGLPAFEAAQLGAHLHGLAGNLAAAELSQPGLIASDLPRFLPKAWAKYIG